MNIRCRLGKGHDKTSVLHSLEPNKPAREYINLRGFALHDENFEAAIVIEVGVTRRYHEVMMGVLKLGELLAYPVCVVIIDKGDGSSHSGTRPRRLFTHKAVADQVAKSLRTIGVAQPRDESVEAFEQVGIERDADSAEDAHGHS